MHLTTFKCDLAVIITIYGTCTRNGNMKLNNVVKITSSIRDGQRLIASKIKVCVYFT